MTRPAFVQSVFDFAIREINALEARIVTAEDEADAMLWEQAGQVVAQLEAGVSQRQLAAQWINARTGEPYGQTHVFRTAKVFTDSFKNQPRPRFRDAYNELANAKAHVSHNSGNNEWYTPPAYIEAARSVLGTIDLDPASSADANTVVKAARFYSVTEDGLAQPWRGRVWMNPPYATELIGAFVRKLLASIQAGDVTAAIVLVNNATETEWFSGLVSEASLLCFLDARVKFWRPSSDEPGAPLQGQTVLYLGPRPKTRTFYEAFRSFGFVVVRADLIANVVLADE